MLNTQKKATNYYFIFISLFVVLFYLIVAVYFPQLYIFSTYEDLYGEWGQTYFFLATFVLSFLNATHVATGRYRLFFALLAFAAFYTFMEEISWGQRLIGFDTPDFFAEHSYQDEANLHNLLTGPVKSWTKTTLTYLLSLGMLGYGVLFPVLLKRQWSLAVWIDQHGIPAPPLGLMPVFLFAAICEIEFFSFNEAEVAELLVAMAMSFTALSFWLERHPQWQVHGLIFCIAMTLSVVLVAYATTYTLINNPAQERKISNRLANGYKKFAKRYKRYDHYQAIIKVLLLYDQLKPENTVILRRLSKNYLLLDDQQNADQFLERAIQIALERVEDNPDNIPALVSLAKSYHQARRPEKVSLYAQQAYEVASQKIKAPKKKKRASGYYWLAKASEQLNKQPEALKYYRKAHKLLPKKKRYKRAYHKKRRLMEKHYAKD